MDDQSFEVRHVSKGRSVTTLQQFLVYQCFDLTTLPSRTALNHQKRYSVILEVAEPLIKQYAETPERAKTVIMLVVFGWNKSLFPPDKQGVVEKEILDQGTGSGPNLGWALIGNLLAMD